MYNGFGYDCVAEKTDRIFGKATNLINKLGFPIGNSTAMNYRRCWAQYFYLNN